jgi:environmental stress-induced protein Ves
MNKPPSIIRFAQYPVSPWKNGGGLLRSIVEGDGWQVRLADIDGSVPFSDYFGFLRHFAIAAGAVVLKFPSGEERRCDPQSDIAIYPGGPAPYCELVSAPPALAFNLIVEPLRVNGAIERVRIGTDPVRLDHAAGRLVAIMVQAGSVGVIGVNGGGGTASAAGASLHADRLDTLIDVPEQGVDLHARAADTIVLAARATPR